MSMSILPGLFGLTAGRTFAFYPPILGIAHNEWRFRRATWSEFIVVNTRSGEEACIPRSFIGDVSANAPVVIVGLKRDVEWRDGLAVPYRRPVVELPIAVNDYAPAAPREARPQRLAPVVNIRLESHTPGYVPRKAVGIFLLGLVASAIVGGLFRPRSWQQLKPGDDYASVIARLGAPEAQRTFVGTNGDVFRSLDYPRKRFTAILEGQTEADARYVGSLDARGKVLGSGLPSDLDILRSIPRF
jgi:hypothetical protein